MNQVYIILQMQESESSSSESLTSLQGKKDGTLCEGTITSASIANIYKLKSYIVNNYSPTFSNLSKDDWPIFTFMLSDRWSLEHKLEKFITIPRRLF